MEQNQQVRRQKMSLSRLEQRKIAEVYEWREPETCEELDELERRMRFERRDMDIEN